MEKIEKSRFDWTGPDRQAGEQMARKSVTYWQDAMRRLGKNKPAVVCACIITIVLLASVLIPLFSHFTINEQHYSHLDAPMMTECTDPAHEGYTHLFGTDSLGRDIFVRVWSGGQVSLFIAVVAVFANLVIGVVYGGISGYVGGAVDNIMMRVVEIINGIPYLMIVILLKMVVGRSDTTGIISLIVAYGVVGWTGTARLVRGQLVALKEQEFVIAAKALGASPARLIGRHLLPNSLSIIIIETTLAIPSAIFTEAFLSFIGMGVSIPYCSWGSLASDGIRVFQMYPSQMIIPAICISVIMLSFNLVGDGLRDALDPRLRR
jgi:ABC-type dipeptide/oligopeptide/nickel transport systems, permease components